MRFEKLAAAALRGHVGCPDSRSSLSEAMGSFSSSTGACLQWVCYTLRRLKPLQTARQPYRLTPTTKSCSNLKLLYSKTVKPSSCDHPSDLQDCAHTGTQPKAPPPKILAEQSGACSPTPSQGAVAAVAGPCRCQESRLSLSEAMRAFPSKGMLCFAPFKSLYKLRDITALPMAKSSRKLKLLYSKTVKPSRDHPSDLQDCAHTSTHSPPVRRTLRT
jgi:hypothetical protein